MIRFGGHLRATRPFTAAAMAGALALTAGCAAEAPPVSEKVNAYYASIEAAASNPALPTPTPMPTAAPVLIPSALLQAGTRTVIFGDSWMQGAGATTRELGYAYQAGVELGWDNQVMGGSGTGYLNPGSSNLGTFAQRVAKLPVDQGVELVVIQGSVNDEYQNLRALPAAITLTLQGLQGKYPRATVVVLGPAPNAVPVTPALLEIDATLRATSASEKLTYISPIAENWITPSNFAGFIDVKQASNPNDAGHAYLAGRLVASLKGLAGTK